MLGWELDRRHLSNKCQESVVIWLLVVSNVASRRGGQLAQLVKQSYPQSASLIDSHMKREQLIDYRLVLFKPTGGLMEMSWGKFCVCLWVCALEILFSGNTLVYISLTECHLQVLCCRCVSCQFVIEESYYIADSDFHTVPQWRHPIKEVRDHLVIASPVLNRAKCKERSAACPPPCPSLCVCELLLSEEIPLNSLIGIPLCFVCNKGMKATGYSSLY